SRESLAGRTLMKRTAMSVALAIAALAWVGAKQVNAQEGEGCSVATLNGTFGIQVTGSIVAFGPIGPVAEAGLIRFDGTGGVSQTTTVSLNGTIIPDRSSLSGSYQVNPDCTGDLSLVLPVGPGVTTTSTSHFVIVDHAKEIR